MEDISPSLNQVKIPAVIRVTGLAELLNQPVTEIIHHLLKNGVLVTLNDNIDFDTAAIVADDFGYKAVLQEEMAVMEAEAGETTTGPLVKRAPVVIMMGHVDHGKTSLLDYIRKTKVAEKESGGITQHMGAYQVELSREVKPQKGVKTKGSKQNNFTDRKITLIDTPGHEAFGAIRAQGTKVTDIVVLVIAADEGVKPQTIEAIDLAHAANVPIIVAATKIDRPGADLEKVKRDLGAQNVLTEAWGGKIPLVGVSAKTGEGVEELLELIWLTAEMADLKASAIGRAKGIIIEVQQDVKVGQMATVIVQSGTLKVGDIFVAGDVYGKVRAMYDYTNRRVDKADLSMPVRIIGFMNAPQAGEVLAVMPDEKSARQLAASRRVVASRRLTTSKTGLSDLLAEMKASGGGNLNVVVKADVQGSLQAIQGQLEQLKTNRGSYVHIVSAGVGNISESDILAAQGGNAFVVGFKVSVLPGAAKIAVKDNIKVLNYDVIYSLTDDLEKLLVEAAGVEHKETIMATGHVLKVFMSTAQKKIVGVKLEKGEARRDHLMRFYRGEEKIGDGKISTIKLVAEEVETASKGNFGFLVEINVKIKEGDKVEFIKVEEIPAELIK